MRNPARIICDLAICIQAATADCETVLELGCGVGDRLAICNARFRHGVDAHLPYLQRARRRWKFRLHALDHCEALVWVDNAVSDKQSSGISWDGILLIDFVEHLGRQGGRILLRRIKNIANRRIVIFCPVGYQPQDEDTYKLGGEKWQRHRSAWWPVDLERRGFDVEVWRDFHGPGLDAMFAIWEQP